MTALLRFGYRSIRGKLTLATLTPLVATLILVSLAASYLINASIVKQTQKQIRNDLNTARVVLSQEQQKVREVVRFTARSANLLKALTSADRQLLAAELNEIRLREQLDILNLTDLHGNPLLNIDGTRPAEGQSAPAFVCSTLKDDHYSGTILLSEHEMRRERPQLAEQARIYSPEQPAILLERRGMFLVAVAHILDAQGNPLGCLYGGIMLNNNLPLVDRISKLIYGQDRFEGIDVGSTTIFLDTLRIATTVRLKNGRRALGTAVSREVAEAVLQREEAWLARAYVVNEWYLTAYEPILDGSGRTVGALYVGMLEKPLTALKNRSFLILFGLLVLGCLLGGLLATLLARRLSRPVLDLASSAKKIAAGEREVSLPNAGQDEIGLLTSAFADMTNALKKSDKELQDLNRQLEEKVAKRTTQLEVKSLQLIKTQEQLLRHEKLAAIGSLATGVAHEINNPAAIIRGNVEILQMSLSADAPEQEEAREIMKQVERVSLITRNLLNFAGKQDLFPEQVQICDLLDEIFAQISHQQPVEQVQIIRHLGELPAIPGDRERLRQVFTNIVLNALQAMAGHGTLTLTGSYDLRQICIAITDTGPGIPAELQGKIFNPFFTSKKQGTGLGLSVSYGIIQSHGGTIELSNEDSGQTRFLISLPRE